MTVLIFLSWLFHCTELPFGDNKISAGHQQISGRVELNDGASPEHVYVWLSGLDIATWTDEAGKFTVKLPPKSIQPVSGTFRLYYYLANYLLAWSEVVIREGEFLYSQGDINNKGELYIPKVMQRFLRISTSVSPASVSENYAYTINVSTTLQATIEVWVLFSLRNSIRLSFLFMARSRTLRPGKG